MDETRIAADNTADAIRYVLRLESGLTAQEQLNVIQSVLTAHAQQEMDRVEKAARP